MVKQTPKGIIADVHRPVLASMRFCDTAMASYDALAITVPVSSVAARPGPPTEFERGFLVAPEKLHVRLPHTIRHLARWLQDLVGKTHAEQAAAELLSLVAVCASDEAARMHLLNVLCDPVSTHLMQYVVTRVSGRATQRFELGEFVLGPFDTEKFLYAAARAGSSGWDRLAASERGNFAIVRCYSARTLPFCVTPLEPPAQSMRLVEGLVASLYSFMAEEAWLNFWAALRDVQLVENAVRTAYLDVDNFRAIALPGAHLWTVFSRVGASSKGWVAPSVAINAMSLPDPRAFGALQRIIRDELKFEGWKDTEISRTLQAYCRMLWRASSHEFSRSIGAADRVDDAFLHHVIAVEMLFSEKNSTTASIARRTAAVIHSQRSQTYADAKAEVETLYEARSRYVHQGVRVREEHLDVARHLTAALSEWLLLLASCSDAKWTMVLKQVDLVVAMIEAGQTPPSELLERLSVQKSSVIPAEMLSKRSASPDDHVTS